MILNMHSFHPASLVPFTCPKSPTFKFVIIATCNSNLYHVCIINLFSPFCIVLKGRI